MPKSFQRSLFKPTPSNLGLQTSLEVIGRKRYPHEIDLGRETGNGYKFVLIRTYEDHSFYRQFGGSMSLMVYEKASQMPEAK